MTSRETKRVRHKGAVCRVRISLDRSGEASVGKRKLHTASTHGDSRAGGATRRSTVFFRTGLVESALMLPQPCRRIGAVANRRATR